MPTQVESIVSQRTLQPPETSSRANARRLTNGLRVEITPSKRSARGYFPRLLEKFALRFRGNLRPAASAARKTLSEKPNKMSSDDWDIVGNGEWIDAPPRSSDWDILAVAELNNAPPTTSGTANARVYLATQPLLHDFVKEYAPQFLRSVSSSDLRQLGHAEYVYLKALGTRLPCMTMPTVLNTPPSSMDLLNGYFLADDHHAIYQKDFSFDPSPLFLKLMQPLWRTIDTEKCRIYKEQRKLIAADTAPPQPPARQEASSGDARLPSDRQQVITAPEPLDRALRSEVIMAAKKRAKEPLDEWAKIRRMCFKSDPTPVSELAEKRSPVTTAGLPISRYRSGQIQLEEKIPTLVAEILEGLNPIDLKNPRPKNLKREEKAYLQDLMVKPPAITMPHVLNTVPPKSTEPTVDHHDAYLRDFKFTLSKDFLAIMQSIWRRIDKEKQDAYWKPKEEKK